MTKIDRLVLKLLGEKVETFSYFGITVDTSGADVPSLWGDYVSTGDERHMLAIAQHNLLDVVREVSLVMKGRLLKEWWVMRKP